MCEFIIGNLDPDGYLRIPDDELARQLGVPVEEVRRAIAIVQQLEPAGIAARTLQECFLLQLDRPTIDVGGDLLALTRRVVAEGFDELLHQRWDRLGAASGHHQGGGPQRRSRCSATSTRGREASSGPTTTSRSSPMWSSRRKPTAGG